MKIRTFRNRCWETSDIDDGLPFRTIRVHRRKKTEGVVNSSESGAKRRKERRKESTVQPAYPSHCNPVSKTGRCHQTYRRELLKSLFNIIELNIFHNNEGFFLTLL